jgi:hypothetical protein
LHFSVRKVQLIRRIKNYEDLTASVHRLLIGLMALKTGWLTLAVDDELGGIVFQLPTHWTGRAGGSYPKHWRKNDPPSDSPDLQRMGRGRQRIISSLSGTNLRAILLIGTEIWMPLLRVICRTCQRMLAFYRAEKKGTRRKQLHITFLRFFSFSTINCKPRFRSLVSILRNTMIQIVPSTIHAYTETNCLFC